MGMMRRDTIRKYYNAENKFASFYWLTFFFFYSFQSKAPGRILFDQVCKQLNLLEVDYFGLEYQDGHGVTVRTFFEISKIFFHGKKMLWNSQADLRVYRNILKTKSFTCTLINFWFLNYRFFHALCRWG